MDAHPVFRRVFQRELGGCHSSAAGTPNAAGWGHQPLAHERACTSDAALVKRLAPLAELPTTASAVNTLSWSEDGEALACGGEDCRVLIWDAQLHHRAHTLDLGHTSTINCVRFLPHSSNEQIVSCGSDRQVRLMNLRKNAAKPFSIHKGKVRTVAVLDANLFMSGSDDGTVRQTDIREPVRSGGTFNEASVSELSNIVADQRQEVMGRMKSRVGITSLAVDPLQPHMFLTGGSDALVRLYDRRMAGGAAGSRATHSPHRTPWLSCFMPTHFKGSLLSAARPFGASPRAVTVSGVAFAHGGKELVVSYNGEHIYAFSVAEHGRPAHAFQASSASPLGHAGHRSRTRQAVINLSRAEVPTARSTGAASGSPEQQAGTGISEGLRRWRQLRGSRRPGAGAGAGPDQAAEGTPPGREAVAATDALAPFVFEHMAPAAAAAVPAVEPPAYMALGRAAALPGGEAAMQQPTAAAPQVGNAAPQAGAPREASERRQGVSGTGSVLPPPAHSVGQPPRAAPPAADSPATTAAAQEQLPQQQQQQQQPSSARRPSSDLHGVTSPLRRAETQAEPQQGTAAGPASDAAIIDEGLAAPDACRDAAAQQDAPDVARPSGRPKRRVAAGDAQPQQPPATRQRRAPHFSGAAQQVPANATDLPDGARRANAAGVGRAAEHHHGMRAPSTLAAEGAAFAVTGCQAERPTASTGTSRPAPEHRSTGRCAAPDPPAHRPSTALGPADSAAAAAADAAVRAEATAAPGSGVAEVARGAAAPGSCREGATAATAPAPRRHMPRTCRRPPILAQGSPAAAGAGAHAASPAGVQPGAAEPQALLDADALAAHTAGAAGPPRQSAPEVAAGSIARRPWSRAAARNAADLAAPAAAAQQGAARGAGSQEAASHQQAGGTLGQGRPRAAQQPEPDCERGRQGASALAGSSGQAIATGPPVRGQRRARHHQVQSLLSSAVGSRQVEDADTDVVEPPAFGYEYAPRRGRSGASSPRGTRSRGGAAATFGASSGARPLRASRYPPALPAAADSAIGAIVEGDSEGEGEEVEENCMYARCFSGHCNVAGHKEVALMGTRSEWVVSGSDDGHVFVWERRSGRLANMLRAGESAPDAPVLCVAPHPFQPVLASAGQDPVVRLWAPLAQEPAQLAAAEGVMRRNAAHLNGRRQQQQPAVVVERPLWLNILHPVGVAAEGAPPGALVPGGGGPGWGDRVQPVQREVRVSVSQAAEDDVDAAPNSFSCSIM